MKPIQNTSRRILNALIWLLPLIAVAIGGVERVRDVFRFLNTNARLAGTMSAEATHLLGREVKVSDVEITGNLWSLSSQNFIRLKGVSLAADPGYILPLVVVDEVALAYNLDQIIRPKNPTLPLIDSLHLEGPHARVERDAKGHYNFDKLLSKLREAGPGGGRSLLDRATVGHGRVDYTDAALSLRKGVAPKPLTTYVEDANATVNIRQGKSIAFTMTGRSDPKLVDRFEAKGVYFTDKPRLAVSLSTVGAQLKTLAERLLLPKEAILNSGIADSNIAAVYTPTPGKSITALNPAGLRLNGSVKVNGLTGRTGRSSEMINVPVAEVALTERGATANVNALVGGARVQVLAQNVDFSLANLLSGKKGAQLPNSFNASGEISVPSISRLETALSSLTAGIVPPKVFQELKQLAGAVTVKFRGDGDVRNPRFTVTASVPKLTTRYGEIAQSDVYARIENHQLRATVTADALGGSIHAKASAALSGKQLWRAQVTGRGLQLAALPPATRRLILKKNELRDVTGQIQFDAKAAGEGVKPPVAEVATTLNDVGLAGQRWQLISVNADTDGKDVTVRRLRLEDKRGYIVATGRVGLKDRDLDLQVAANEINVPEVLDAVGDIAPRFAPKFNLPLSPSETDAILYLRGDRSSAATITGKWTDPRINGRLTAFNLLAGRLELDKAVATFDVNRDRLIITSGSVARAPGNVTFSGIIDEPLSKDPDISVTANIDSLDLNYLLYEAGLRQPDVRVTGTISSENPILITGTVSNPQLREPAKMVLERSSINGVPIKDGMAQADFRDGKLTLMEAKVDGLNGSITASGTATKEGALNLSVAVNNLDLSEADAFLPDTASLVRGKLSATLNVQGTIKSPEIAATVNGSSLGFGAYALGDLTGSASLVDHVANVKDFKIVEAGDVAKSIPPRTLALSSASYNLDTHEISAAGSWDGITETRIRGLLQGVLDANASDIAFRNNLAQLIGNLPPFLPGPSGLPAFILLAQQSKDPFAMVETAAKLVENLKINLAGAFAVKGTDSAPVATVTLAESPIQVGGLDLVLKKTTATITKNSLDAPEIEFTAVDGDLIARNTHVDFKGDIRSDIDGYNLNLAPFSKFMKSRSPDAVDDYSIGGTANIGIQVRGKTAAPEIEQASVNLSDVALYRLPVGVTVSPGTPPSTELIYKLNRIDINNLTLKDGVLASDDLRVTVKSTVARGKFSASGIEYSPPFLAPTAPLHAEISLLPKNPDDKNLQELASLAPAFLDSRSSGTVAFRASVDGTPADPLASIKGTLEVAASRLQIGKVPGLQIQSLSTGFENLDALFEFSGDLMQVARFSAQSRSFEGKQALNPKTPNIAMSGALPINNRARRLHPDAQGIRLTVNRLYAEERKIPIAGAGSLTAFLDANVLVGNTVSNPKISGGATLYDSVLAVPPAFAPPGVGGGKRSFNPEFDDLKLVFGRNVKISNPLLDTQLTGDIALNGTLDDPHLNGQLALQGGKLTLTTTRLNIRQPSTISVVYPIIDNGVPALSVNVDLRADGLLSVPSSFGTRKDNVTIQVKGPITGEVVDPVSGQSRLQITSNNPSLTQAALLRTLAIGDPNGLDTLGTNPGSVIANQLTNVFTGAVIPKFFDAFASQFGFESFELGYDPIQNFNLTLSRRVFGPFYVSYQRSLGAGQERYTFRGSIRFSERFQTTYEVNERNEQRVLLEGVFRF